MGMISEFKEFAMKGSLIDMAVGIIIGGAVGKMIIVIAFQTSDLPTNNLKLFI